MRKHLLLLVTGVVLSILVQTFIAVAETWSFGPSLDPLRTIFGPFTFPVVTSVSLGVPIGLAYFGAARVLAVQGLLQVLSLVAAFTLLQAINLLAATSSGYAWFYATVYVATCGIGVLAEVKWATLHRSVQRAAA